MECVQISVGMNSWVLCNMKKVGLLLVVIGIMSLSGCTGQEVEYTKVNLGSVINNPSYYVDGYYKVIGYLEPVLIAKVWAGYNVVTQLHVTEDINSSSITYQFFARGQGNLLASYVGKVMPEPITRVVDVSLSYGVWILRVPD